MNYQDSTRQRTPVRIALEQVLNALNSISLLSQSGRLPGLNSWVVQTSALLTPEIRDMNRLIFEGLRDAILPEHNTPDFPTYLKNFSEQDPFVVRYHFLERLRSRFSRRFSSENSVVAPDQARLLGDVSAYLTCVEYIQAETPFDPALHTEVYALLSDAPALRQLIISHLETMWKTFLAKEWRRVQSKLRWQVEMFTHSIEEDRFIEENYHTITGRALPSAIIGKLAETPEIILVPSWHTGRYVTSWESDAGTWLFFSEPPNYDVEALNAIPVGRGELRSRLATLADETRLRILDLLAHQDELYAQDIIAALDLSQSSVSRHLKQLVSMGYLYERRGEGANKTYRLSSFYLKRTAHALEQIGSGEEIKPLTATNDETQSKELRRFLDGTGKLAMWPPSKSRDKLLILEYLASFFEQGRVYSEKEVNNLLLLHTTFNDSAALRRAFFEYRFMNRTRDGSQYWLIGSTAPEELTDQELHD